MQEDVQDNQDGGVGEDHKGVEDCYGEVDDHRTSESSVGWALTGATAYQFEGSLISKPAFKVMSVPATAYIPSHSSPTNFNYLNIVQLTN